ncbi:hypothetical protein [Fictibacillus sp. 18YEL24]|uniref:hypothetical protein n=1 Tax=Fictibacillus sp. 18YEL24 TaxID=2745875 RepID=UPI0018CF9F69|nr:hypothetical protein [Fictibacillus sp. 18YEL24]MBH0171680.1 hypothetical protein [Fictibacillus sp. 18YEL24]
MKIKLRPFLASCAVMVLLLIQFTPMVAYATITPWEGNPWEGNEWNKNSWDGVTWESEEWEKDGFSSDSDTVLKPYEPKKIKKTDSQELTDEAWYKTAKLVGKDMFLATVDGLSSQDGIAGFQQADWRKGNWGEISSKALRAGIGELIPENNTDAKFVFDLASGVDNYLYARDFYQSADKITDAMKVSQLGTGYFQSASVASQKANQLKNVLTTASKLPNSLTTGIASKVAPWTAAASGAISGVEAYDNFFNKGEFNKGVGNVGEVVMSGALVATAFGVGTPIVAGVATVGFGIWGVSKAIEHRKSIGRAIRNPKKTLIKTGKGVIAAGKKIGKGISKGAGFVKSIFS